MSKQIVTLHTLKARLAAVDQLISNINDDMGDIEDNALWELLNDRLQMLMSAKAAVAMAVNKALQETK